MPGMLSKELSERREAVEVEVPRGNDGSSRGRCAEARSFGYDLGKHPAHEGGIVGAQYRDDVSTGLRMGEEAGRRGGCEGSEPGIGVLEDSRAEQGNGSSRDIGVS